MATTFQVVRLLEEHAQSPLLRSIAASLQSIAVGDSRCRGDERMDCVAEEGRTGPLPSPGLDAISSPWPGGSSDAEADGTTHSALERVKQALATKLSDAVEPLKGAENLRESQA